MNICVSVQHLQMSGQINIFPDVFQGKSLKLFRSLHSIFYIVYSLVLVLYSNGIYECSNCNPLSTCNIVFCSSSHRI